MPNSLIHESSPYLLQHAHNPVEWYAWGDAALQKAQSENKPILVSIGYAACHWCHVMERESFENQAIAELMNQFFVCIKIDREERPDIDSIYMDAVQAMGVQGGWPLNVFLMPDTKPFYGGTYFPPQKWGELLQSVAQAFVEHRPQLQQSAENFAKSISEQQLTLSEEPLNNINIEGIYDTLAQYFDTDRGGMKRSPKFPMPSIWAFLLRYVQQSQNDAAKKQLHLTLRRMACGGIYDTLGGGWTRYSTDADWFAPHFEKMLYDNGQLLSLYADAYCIDNQLIYKQVAYQTIAWLEREMSHEKGAFFSALDADSEGDEGKFYCWEKAEIESILGEDAVEFCALYHISETGNWEHQKNILHASEVIEWKPEWRKALFEAREKRIRPALDDKILASWNGLMLKGLVDAYRVFGEPTFLDLAQQNANFIAANMLLPNGQLWHNYKNGKANIMAFLEDYAAVIAAYTALYQVCFDEKWLGYAETLTDYVLENFYDADTGFFFFTDRNAQKLIARKKEMFDNVVPASNSIMAQNLYTLGLILSKTTYTELSERMLSSMKDLISKDPQWLSNWAILLTCHSSPTAEIAIVGKEAETFRKELEQHYLPNKIIVGTTDNSTLPLLQGRTAIAGKTTIYVCFNKSCRLPVFSVSEAIEQIYG